MKTLLLYPPITDPTSGYHSLCYIETYARKHGFADIDIMDTNIEGLLHTMQPHKVRQIMQSISRRKRYLQSRDKLNGIEQNELYCAWIAEHSDFEETLPQAVTVMRDETLFFDYERYRAAAETISHWISTLSLMGYPGQFQGTYLHTHGYFNLFSSRDMQDGEIISRICGPFEDYFREKLLEQIRQKCYTIVGINITYVSQLPFALGIARMIREAFPNMHIWFGGTEVSDVWKYLLDKRTFFDIFNAADACVIGEGETAFVALLRMVQNGQGYQSHPNVVVHPKHGVPFSEAVPIHYENIAALPTPDYSKLPWDKYLSPYPFIYYSPSRGCYWNRCTFCDYGLNFESPTSPWRQNQLDKIMEDLSILSQSYKYIYFSVDVLSPALLLQLAEKIIEAGLDIRWGAEIRLEKYWSPERCKLLRESGCVAISVGFESGNQRVLDLIDKGTKVPRIQETIQNFSSAGIGVQMMGFTGFPTETFEEAMESVQFLKENRLFWTFGGLGNFVLTKGAIVAKQPERFKLTELRPYQGEDIAWQLYYKDSTGGHGSEEQEAALQKAKGELAGNDLERPWTGGIDTAHSYFYHDRFGSGILDVINNSRKGEVYPYYTYFLNGKIAYDIPGYPVSSLIKKDDLKQVINNFKMLGIGPTAREIKEFLSEKLLSRQSDPSVQRYFIRADGLVYPFPDVMLDFLENFVEGLSFQQFLQKAGDHSLYRKLFEHSLKHHFLKTKKELVPADQLYTANMS